MFLNSDDLTVSFQIFVLCLDYVDNEFVFFSGKRRRRFANTWQRNGSCPPIVSVKITRIVIFASTARTIALRMVLEWNSSRTIALSEFTVHTIKFYLFYHIHLCFQYCSYVFCKFVLNVRSRLPCLTEISGCVWRAI